MPEHVWAVDPAMGRLAFAFASLDQRQCETWVLELDTDKAREGERLGQISKAVHTFALARRMDFPPACVWVEQPSGRFRNLPLTYAVGVIQAELYETLAVPVWTMPSSGWKRATVGTGNATKEQVRAWAEKHGARQFFSQDESDAYAIACAGRAMLLEGQWDVAAA